MSKLTLSVDDRIIARAKRYAEKRQTSVSRLVEQFLGLITQAPPRDEEPPPVLARLRGALAGTDPEAHRRHLRDKYR